MADYLPGQLSEIEDFKEFLKRPDLVNLEEFSDYLVMNLPKPRASFYESNDYDEI